MFFSDGMHQDVITNLLLIRELACVPHTTVMSYRGTKKSHREIAEELGVAYVLTGSVRRADKKVRIRDAATLALLYSDLKKSGKGDVTYTRRKWVKKAKGQAPGAVIVTQEKSLHVSLEKKRLDALKARSGRE